MITFTKEQLIASAHARIEFAEMMLAGELEPLKECTWSIELELARIALASLEAEPVCVIDQSNLDYLKSGSDADVWPASRTEMGDMLLYRAAPPAPVLPRDLEEIIFTIVNAMADEKLRNDESELFSLAKKYIEHAKSKLGAAMLQDAEPVSQRYKLRDAVETIRNSGIVIDADKIFAERDALNSPVIPDGVCPCCGRKLLKNRTCSVAGCDGKHVARGFCIKHYAIERKKDPSRRESIRAADKRYRARKAAAPQQEVK